MCFYKVGRNFLEEFLVLGTRFRFETKRGNILGRKCWGKRKVNCEIYKLCTIFLINYFLIRLSKNENFAQFCKNYAQNCAKTFLPTLQKHKFLKILKFLKKFRAKIFDFDLNSLPLTGKVKFLNFTDFQKVAM